LDSKTSKYITRTFFVKYITSSYGEKNGSKSQEIYIAKKKYRKIENKHACNKEKTAAPPAVVQHRNNSEIKANILIIVHIICSQTRVHNEIKKFATYK
jgi:ribosomal protein S24E